MEKVGVEGLEKAMDIAVKNIVLGIKIGKDGVNKEDNLKNTASLIHHVLDIQLNH